MFLLLVMHLPTCVKCDHEIPAEAAFCPNCGAPTTPVVATPPIGRTRKSEIISQMPKLDSQEIATKIFDRFITAVRDYVREMEDVYVSALKKGLEKKGIKDAHWPTEYIRRMLCNPMVQPLERIRDYVSKCRSPTELESAVDSLIKLFQDKVHVSEAQKMYRDSWSKYLQMLATLALEINNYYVKQYFPMQRDFVHVKIKVSKGFMTPAPLAPIKVYFDSNYFQYGFTTRKGEAGFRLPKGKKFTFCASKDGKKVSKSIFLSRDTEIKL